MGGESRNTGAGAAWSGPVSQVLPNAVLSVEALAVAAVEPRPQPQASQTLHKKLLGHHAHPQAAFRVRRWRGSDQATAIGAHSLPATAAAAPSTATAAQPSGNRGPKRQQLV